ncbi:unnamed protein product [Alopecurus aequalis]
MQGTDNLVKLFTEWEIQLLVLLSFALQLFLFFAGGLRRHGWRGFLRVCSWMAYLGADFVAVYALGYLSRHDQDESREIKPLAFFWAPFLLVHLGGQDTITAFSMEDNNLWLRHLLNLVVQVILALYVFWKSIGRLKSAELLASGVLVFAAGIIKYVERIWCLKRASFTAGLESRNLTQWATNVDHGSHGRTRIASALTSMSFVFRLFGTLADSRDKHFEKHEDMNEYVKVTRLNIGLMYDELYTKTHMLRSRGFMIFRHISQISVVVAFALFQCSIKQGRFVKADVAITYSLFMGAFFLEVCSMINSMLSPWTWKMFKDRKWEWLARLSWSILSSDMGWPEKKQRWPCSFGQYDFLSWLTNSDRQVPRKRTFSQGVMAVVRKVFVDVMGINKKRIHWMSKVLDTWYIEADQVIIDNIASETYLLIQEHDLVTPTREWPNLREMMPHLQEEFEGNFGKAIVLMHVRTEQHLRRYFPPSSDMAAADDDGTFGMAQICRKLSNYMMYLLVANPSMLPLTTSSARVLQSCHDHQHRLLDIEFDLNLRPNKETVEEMVYMWTRLLLYAADKSRPEVHASQLANAGGELITLAWLHMSLYRLGDSRDKRVGIFKTSTRDVRDIHAFNFSARTNEHAAAAAAGSSDGNRAS